MVADTQINKQAIQIKTADDRLLHLTKFSDSTGPSVIIIAPATGVAQHYYFNFANYLAQEGFHVLTFDYRGIRVSSKKELRKDSSTLTDWGKRDLDEVIRWAGKMYKNIYLIGHSIAGQIFPLADSHPKVKAAYFVGSQTASYHFWGGKERIQVLLFWKVFIPTLTRVLGYLPGWSMGGKVHLPKEIALEWRKWGIHPLGVLQGNNEIKDRFASVKIPIHFVSLEHDKLLAPEKATRELITYYTRAQATHDHIKAADINTKKLGHFDFFRKKYKKELWYKPILYFQLVSKPSLMGLN